MQLSVRGGILAELTMLCHRNNCKPIVNGRPLQADPSLRSVRRGGTTRACGACIVRTTPVVTDVHCILIPLSKADNVAIVIVDIATMDRFDAMRLFVRVAELGRFSAVALQASVTRSVVTRQIVALEAHLAVKLTARSTRRLALTSAGSAYLEECRVILNLIEEGIDLAIRITRRLEPGDVARKIGTGRMLVVAAPEYLARHGRPQHPAELANHECLGYTHVGSPMPWQFLVNGQPENFTVRSRINANNGDVLTEAAAQGLGITLQPDFIVAGYLDAGRVEQILADFAIPELGIYAMLPSNRHVPHRVRVLMDALAAALAAP